MGWQAGPFPANAHRCQPGGHPVGLPLRQEPPEGRRRQTQREQTPRKQSVITNRTGNESISPTSRTEGQDNSPQHQVRRSPFAIPKTRRSKVPTRTPRNSRRRSPRRNPTSDHARRAHRFGSSGDRRFRQMAAPPANQNAKTPARQGLTGASSGSTSRSRDPPSAAAAARVRATAAGLPSVRPRSGVSRPRESRTSC
jgi:hypothetical protein